MRRLAAHPVALLTLLTFLLYLPPALRVVQIDYDVPEYVDVGRRLADGQGYLLGIKAYHTGGTSVVHDGLDERAPLFPLLIAAVLRLGGDLSTVQAVDALLAAGCVALVAELGRLQFGRGVGLLAGLLAAASPIVLVQLVPAMSEALGLFLMLLACWLVLRKPDRPRPAAWLAAGLVFGLAYVTRPMMLLLALGLLPALWFATPARRPVQPLAALLVGLLLVVGPVTAWSLASRGTWSYSGQTYLLSVLSDKEVRGLSTLQPLPRPGTFLAEQRETVLSQVGANLRAYGGVVFLDGAWLLALLPAWPAMLFAAVRGRLPRAAVTLLYLAGLNFAAHALVWSNYQPRYQILTLLLLLPLGVEGLGRLGLARLRWPRTRVGAHQLAVLALALFWSQTLIRQYQGEFTFGHRPVDRPSRPRTDFGLTWSGPTQWVKDDDLFKVMDWVYANAGPDDALAHPEPQPLSFFTRRPSALIPARLDAEGLRRFVVDYRLSFVILSREDTTPAYRKDYQDWFGNLGPAGVRTISIGSYRVFDVRALWQRPTAGRGESAAP